MKIYFLNQNNLNRNKWGLGIGDWGLGPMPNPQSSIPNPQSPLIKLKGFFYLG